MRINYLMHKKKADEGEAAAESVIVPGIYTWAIWAMLRTRSQSY